MQSAAILLSLVQAVTTTPPASQPSAAPPAPAGPVVVLDVVQAGRPLGAIKLALDAAKAPLTVENFLKYVRAGHYDGTTFHRVIPGFMIQGGGFTPTMVEKP